MGLSVKSKQKTHVAWDYGSSRNTVELHPQDASIQTICSCCCTQVSNGLTEKGLQIERQDRSTFLTASVEHGACA